MVINVSLVAEIDFPHVHLSLPSGVKLKSFYAVIDNGEGCEDCCLINSYLCRHVECNNVIYVPVIDTPCL